PRVAAGADRDRPPAADPLRHDDSREHCLWEARRHARGRGGCGPRRRHPRLHHEPPDRLRHGDRGGRRQPVGRAAAEDRDRPRDHQESPHPHPRRADDGPRRRRGGRGERDPPPPRAGEDRLPRRPPAGGRGGRRRHHRAPRRRRARAGHARQAPARRRLVPVDLHAAARRQPRSPPRSGAAPGEEVGLVNPEHIRILLDADAMHRLLGAIPLLAEGDARLTAMSLDRLWVKPGRHFHASYRVALVTEAGPCETHACAGLRRSERELSPLRQTPPPGPASWDLERATVRMKSPPLTLALFPWDARLPTLPLALDPQRVAAALGGVRLGGCAVAGYWPGIRCQLRYDLEDAPGIVYGKVFPEGAGHAIAVAQTAVTRDAASTPFAIPRVRAYLPRLNLLLTEPVEGEPLLDLLPDATPALLERVATALPGFPALPTAEVERRFGPAEDLAIVHSWVDLIGTLFPRLVAPLAAALAAVHRRVPPDAIAPPALVHRDFYDKQVLVG